MGQSRKMLKDKAQGFQLKRPADHYKNRKKIHDRQIKNYDVESALLIFFGRDKKIKFPVFQ